MKVTIRKIGNSLGIIIPKYLVKSMGLKSGQEINFEDMVDITEKKIQIDYDYLTDQIVDKVTRKLRE